MTCWPGSALFAAICLPVRFVPNLAEEAGLGGPRPLTVDDLRSALEALHDSGPQEQRTEKEQ